MIGIPSLQSVVNFINSLPVKEDKAILTMPDNSSIDESRIVVDYSVVEKWHKGWKRDLSMVEEVVLHHTEGDGDVFGLRDWMLKGERSNLYKKATALFHFGVSPDGGIMKFAPLARWYYHSTSQTHDKKTVGIELCHHTGPFTEQQYASIGWLVFEYVAFHCPNLHRLVGHDYNAKVYSNTSKGCPGKDLDWSKIEAIGAEKGFKMNKIFYQAYEMERA